jgi:hypothetical protein
MHTGSIGGVIAAAYHGFRVGLQRPRLVIPLGEIAHQRQRILRGMGGRHAGRTRRGIDVVADHFDLDFLLQI